MFKWPGFFLLLSAYFQSSKQKAFRTDFRGLISYSFPNLTVTYSEETLPTVWQGPLTSGVFFHLKTLIFIMDNKYCQLLFYFFLIFYYWSILTLQCCVSFCFTRVWISYQFSSVTQLCPTVCDPMDCSTPGLPVHHQLPEFTQTHAHWVSDAIQPSHPLSSPSPPTFNLSQHQGLFQ